MEMAAGEAYKAILRGDAPAGLIVHGLLRFDASDPSWLPDDLHVDYLVLQDCGRLHTLPRRLHCKELVAWRTPLDALPLDLHVESRLTLGDVPGVKELPSGLHLDQLTLIRCRNLVALPGDITVRTSLDLSGCEALEKLPAGLHLTNLDVSGCSALTALPEDLQVSDDLKAAGCTRLQSLPAGLHLQKLHLQGCKAIHTLPPDLRVTDELILRNCVALKELPVGMTVRRLDLTGCTSLPALPGELDVQYLTLAGCSALEEWPSAGLPSLIRLDLHGCSSLSSWPITGPARLKELNLGDCVRLEALPGWLHEVEELNLAGCRRLSSLPDHLRVTVWLDIAGTPLRQLSPSSAGFRLRWRGVPISGRVVFHPDTLTAQEVLSEANAEIRRVMLERMGYEQFFAKAQATVLDQDTDAGGQRRLLRVELTRDEPLVCLEVRDPSTQRQYLLRVPPHVRRCRQAAAWIAGFEDPDLYHPVVET